MISKLLEVRDDGTTMPVLAIKTAGEHEANDAEAWLWRRSGYGGDAGYVILVSLNPQGGRIEAQFDAYEWRFVHRGRTLAEAHHYIEAHFDELTSGDVVDVEYLLGETEKPKQSERKEWERLCKP